MSTCRGCYRDDSVPSGVGVLMTVNGPGMVSHEPTERCPIPGGQPHDMPECGEFDPVRPGFEPPPTPERGGRYLMTFYDWGYAFDQLERGRTFLSVLEEIRDIQPPGL